MDLNERQVYEISYSIIVVVLHTHTHTLTHTNVHAQRLQACRQRRKNKLDLGGSSVWALEWTVCRNAFFEKTVQMRRPHSEKDTNDQHGMVDEYRIISIIK